MFGERTAFDTIRMVRQSKEKLIVEILVRQNIPQRLRVFGAFETNDALFCVQNIRWDAFLAGIPTVQCINAGKRLRTRLRLTIEPTVERGKRHAALIRKIFLRQDSLTC